MSAPFPGRGAEAGPWGGLMGTLKSSVSASICAALLRGKSAIEQIRRMGRALPRRGVAHDHDNDLAPLARRAGDEIEASGTSKARLHAVSARITADHAIMRGNNPVSQLERADIEQVGVFRESQQERTTEDRHIPC